MIKADDLAFVGEGKKEVGIEIHSGRNRIVRRIFEHLGYDVLRIDRVAFAGLTKKNLPRGNWRFLTEQEIINLKNS
jgi:23S rRNA pseudouridine2605 synthase